MNIRIAPLAIAPLVLALGLFSSTAQAALEGRDLNGSAGSFEAYYDTDLDITWLADANYAKTSGYDADGLMTWANANAWAASLSFTDGVNTYDNWRLPTVNPVNGSTFNYNVSTDGSSDLGFNISEQGTAFAGSTANEMAHLYYNTLNNPSLYTPAGADSGCEVSPFDTCLDNVGPFTNLLATRYWSATEVDSPFSSAVFYFNFSAGSQFDDGKNSGLLALAVSSGDVAAVPEADTWAMLLAGLGLVGVAVRRRR